MVKTLGADVLVIENLAWKEAYYELSAKLINVSTDKELVTYMVKTARPATDNDAAPMFFRDSEDGPFLIIPRGDPTHFAPFKYPTCDKCPDPNYSEVARRKKIEGTFGFMATVSDQGQATQIASVNSIDPGLTASALQAVRSWRFKPAVGLDGKPIAVRVPVEFTFRLAH